MTFSHPLGLRQYEWNLIRDALAAYRYVANGHFLPTPCKANSNAAARMVERGYLSMADHQLSPPHADWIVVVVTQANLDAYNHDLEALRQQDSAP